MNSEKYTAFGRIKSLYILNVLLFTIIHFNYHYAYKEPIHVASFSIKTQTNHLKSNCQWFVLSSVFTLFITQNSNNTERQY